MDIGYVELTCADSMRKRLIGSEQIEENYNFHKKRRDNEYRAINKRNSNYFNLFIVVMSAILDFM